MATRGRQMMQPSPHLSLIFTHSASLNVSLLVLKKRPRQTTSHAANSRHLQTFRSTSNANRELALPVDPALMVWTGAPGDRQEVRGESPLR
jgi:hypothetical protein